MNEKLKKNGGAILTLVCVLAWGGVTLRETRAKDTYNEFSTACSQPLAQQDALLDKVKEGLEEEKLPGWVETSEKIQSQLEAVPAPNDEIEPLKKVLLERAECLTEALRLIHLFVKTSDKEEEAKYEAEFTAKFKEAGKKLDEFVALRDAYFKKYDLKLE